MLTRTAPVDHQPTSSPGANCQDNQCLTFLTDEPIGTRAGTRVPTRLRVEWHLAVQPCQCFNGIVTTDTLEGRPSVTRHLYDIRQTQRVAVSEFPFEADARGATLASINRPTAGSKSSVVQQRDGQLLRGAVANQRNCGRLARAHIFQCLLG
jgi:hypothetical protein